MHIEFKSFTLVILKYMTTEIKLATGFRRFAPIIFTPHRKSPEIALSRNRKKIIYQKFTGAIIGD